MYSRGKIYKLCSSNLDRCYIGSTCNELRVRKRQHKTAWERKDKQITTSSQIFEAGGEITIVLIEEFACASKMELERRERFHIENNNCVNKLLPAPTPEEVKEYNKEYREANAEEINRKQKEYRKANAEELRRKKKEYTEENREEINQRRRTRVKCEFCEKEMSKVCLLPHKKRKHLVRELEVKD